MPHPIVLTVVSCLLAAFASPVDPGEPRIAAAPGIMDTDRTQSEARDEMIDAKLHDPDAPGGNPGTMPAVLRIVDASLVTQVTGGTRAANDTASRWGVHGTDLGHMLWHRGRLYMVFGDTFGKGGLGGRNWRSNTLARLADPDPAQGLHIEEMISGPGGAARELIPSRKIEGIEKTVIPTNGVSIDGRMYLHYMSVTRWGDGGGKWDVRHSGLAYSDDDGRTWVTPQNAIRPGGSGFEQVAFVRSDGYLYTFGIPGGRWGGIRLSRVSPGAILDRAAYEYWNGRGWTADAAAAALVVPAPAGELSVAWNERHGLWLMMYLNPGRRAAVLRTASALAGPWSEEQVVVTADEYPGLYAPYIVPVPGIGDDVYFTISMWKHYNVFLMRMKLNGNTMTADSGGTT